jgi:hypothetical protein
MKKVLVCLLISSMISSCGKFQQGEVIEDPSREFQPSEAEKLTDEETDHVQTICTRSLEATARFKLQVDAEREYYFDSIYSGCDEKVLTKQVKLNLKMDESKLIYSPIGIVDKNFYFSDFANLEHPVLAEYCKNSSGEYLRYGTSNGITTKSSFLKGSKCDDNNNMICFKLENAVKGDQGQYKVLRKEEFKFMVQTDHKFDGLVVTRSSKDYDLCSDSQVIEKKSTLTKYE